MHLAVNLSDQAQPRQSDNPRRGCTGWRISSVADTSYSGSARSADKPGARHNVGASAPASAGCRHNGEAAVKNPPSDAIVFFGATGDLAYKQIFPALLGMVRDEGLNIPIVGMGRAGRTLDQLKARAADSLAHHAPPHPRNAEATQRLMDLLRYVDGNYSDPASFT